MAWTADSGMGRNQFRLCQRSVPKQHGPAMLFRRVRSRDALISPEPKRHLRLAMPAEVAIRACLRGDDHVKPPNLVRASRCPARHPLPGTANLPRKRSQRKG